MNQHDALSESPKHRRLVNGSMAAAHTYVRDTKEGISSSYTHLAMHIARIQHRDHGHFCILAPQAGGGGHIERGKKKMNSMKDKNYRRYF